ncbi:unnamed protein product [Amoebophrya sp. A25]|nr:unnamed protein product [Amoebophrya sp. A25]|eukprot:GSA25T00000289001.1
MRHATRAHKVLVPDAALRPYVAVEQCTSGPHSGSSLAEELLMLDGAQIDEESGVAASASRSEGSKLQGTEHSAHAVTKTSRRGKFLQDICGLKSMLVGSKADVPTSDLRSNFANPDTTVYGNPFSPYFTDSRRSVVIGNSYLLDSSSRGNTVLDDKNDMDEEYLSSQEFEEAERELYATTRDKNRHAFVRTDLVATSRESAHLFVDFYRDYLEYEEWRAYSLPGARKVDFLWSLPVCRLPEPSAGFLEGIRGALDGEVSARTRKKSDIAKIDVLGTRPEAYTKALLEAFLTNLVSRFFSDLTEGAEDCGEAAEKSDPSHGVVEQITAQSRTAILGILRRLVSGVIDSQLTADIENFGPREGLRKLFTWIMRVYGFIGVPVRPLDRGPDWNVRYTLIDPNAVEVSIAPYLGNRMNNGGDDPPVGDEVKDKRNELQHQEIGGLEDGGQAYSALCVPPSDKYLLPAFTTATKKRERISTEDLARRTEEAEVPRPLPVPGISAYYGSIVISSPESKLKTSYVYPVHQEPLPEFLETAIELENEGHRRSALKAAALRSGRASTSSVLFGKSSTSVERSTSPSPSSSDSEDDNDKGSTSTTSSTSSQHPLRRYHPLLPLSRPKALIFDRPPAYPRRILNLENVAHFLLRKFGTSFDWHVVNGLEQFSGADQMRLFAQSSLVIGATGTSMHFLLAMRDDEKKHPKGTKIDERGFHDPAAEDARQGHEQLKMKHEELLPLLTHTESLRRGIRPTVIEFAPLQYKPRDLEYYECNDNFFLDKYSWIGGQARQQQIRHICLRAQAVFEWDTFSKADSFGRVVSQSRSQWRQAHLRVTNLTQLENIISDVVLKEVVSQW